LKITQAGPGLIEKFAYLDDEIAAFGGDNSLEPIMGREVTFFIERTTGRLCA